MKNIRLIARLDIKGSNVIKGIRLEGLRIVGSPSEMALSYYSQGIDEIIYMDSVATLYGRNHLGNIVEEAARDIFIPMTVGGGIRSIEDASQILRSGADKIAVNTAAILQPQIISKIANRFGSQCVVLSVEAKKVAPNRWEAYTNNGREKTGKDIIEWIKEAIDLGAGEILITSVDREGTCKGFDLPLVFAVSSAASVPVIASGGMGCFRDFEEVVKNSGANAVAMAHVLHYNVVTVKEIRDQASKASIHVRKYECP